jgi:MerR family transcriptional regulator, light-induced transcriptional regulator
MQNVQFTPPQLAPLFGVNVSTIKRWADRGFLPSNVTAGGHRRITQEQLNEFIKKNPKYTKNSYVLRRLLKKDTCPPDNCWRNYYNSLEKNDTAAAQKIIDKLYLRGTPIIDILSSTITPTLRQIGGQWEGKKISVYEEHRMSFQIRLHLMHLDQLLPAVNDRKAPQAILACAPHEHHELPLQLVALILKKRGWKTSILGINISIKELLLAADEIKPRLMVISRTYIQKESNDYFTKLTSYADQRHICIAFGGAAWQKKLAHAHWAKKKCVHYFPSLKMFDEHLRNFRK